MKARLKQDVVRGNRIYPRGLECELLESFYMYRLGVGEGVVLEVWGNLVRIGCEVPGCTREATHDSPRHWCKVHWDQWFNHDGEEDEPEWMDLERDGWEPSDAYKEQCEAYGKWEEGRVEKIAELVGEIGKTPMPDGWDRILEFLATISERLLNSERRVLRTLRMRTLEQGSIVLMKMPGDVEQLLMGPHEVADVDPFACPRLRDMRLIDILEERREPAVKRKAGASLGEVFDMTVYSVRMTGPVSMLVLARSLDNLEGQR